MGATKARDGLDGCEDCAGDSLLRVYRIVSGYFCSLEGYVRGISIVGDDPGIFGKL